MPDAQAATPVAADPPIVANGTSRARYDLTAVLGAGPAATDDRAALVIAAFAITVCRWTAVDEVAVAVTGPGGRIGATSVTRLRIDDATAVEEFLRAVLAIRSGSAPAGPDGGHADLVIVSGHPDLRSGEIRFGVDVPDAASGFVADVATAVTELASRAGALREVRCIAPARRALLHALAGADVPAVDLETLFLEQVRCHPQRVAVRDAGGELTYQQLAVASAQHADDLRRAGVRCGDSVLVATQRSVAEVVALLAIVRLGAAYSGFDDDAPPARADQIIGKLVPAAAVVDASMADHPSLWALTRVAAWHPGPGRDTDGDAADRRLSAADPGRPAYIAFTSGSTGTPKGVVIPHRAVTRLALTVELRTRPGDRVLRMAPLAFDASTFEVWVTLLTGATLEAFPGKLLSASRIEAFLAERQITIAWLTASLFRLIAQSRPAALAGLRWLLTGGEVVPHECAARMLAMHPGLMITNGYGPTENTTFTATYTVRDSAEIDGPLPIGRPIAGTRVLILDRDARPVPPGAVGELYAAGLGLADGYLGDEAETRTRFGAFSPDTAERLYRTGDLVRLDPTGHLRYLGRADTQIKLNGHRIETEEISTALAAHPDVRDAVILTARPDCGLHLVAAVVLRPDAEADPRALRAHLAQRLPSYMLPARWAVVDEIPLTRNGKVDADALIASATST
jgi:amino acid adenylation domain-containing protein